MRTQQSWCRPLSASPGPYILQLDGVQWHFKAKKPQWQKWHFRVTDTTENGNFRWIQRRVCGCCCCCCCVVVASPFNTYQVIFSWNQAAVYFAIRPKHGLGNKKKNTKSHTCCVQSAAQRPLHPRVAIDEHDPAHLWVTKQLGTPIPSYDGFQNIYLHFKDGTFS